MSAVLFIMGDMHHGDGAKIYWICDQNVKHSLAGIDKAKEVLGYEVRVDFREGLKRTVEYFQ